MVTFLALALRRVKRSQALKLALIGTACLLVGAELFSATQSVSFGKALYWAVTTATTVGYGDVTPKNTAGRVIAVGVMLTTIPLFASAFAYFAGVVVTANVRRLFGMGRPETTSATVVILGLSPPVPRVVAELREAGREVMLVAKCDRSVVPEDVMVVNADPTDEDAVRRVHPEKAGQLLITGATDADVLVSAVLLRHLAPAVPTLAVASSTSVCRALEELGVQTTLSADELLVHTLAKSLEAPHAGELLLRLVDSEGYRLREIPVGTDQQGRSLRTVRADHPGLVLGAVREGRVTVGLARDLVLNDGDRLIVLEAEQAQAL